MKFKEIESDICTCIICNNKTLNNIIEKKFVICDNCHEEITNMNIGESKYELYLNKIKKLFLNNYNI